MKRIFTFIPVVLVTAALLCSLAGGGAGASGRSASAAALPEKSTVTYAFYDMGSASGEQYTIELGAASQRKIEGAGYTTANFLKEVEKFAAAYEALMFHPTADIKLKTDADTLTELNLTMYVEFPATDDYYAYYGLTRPGAPRPPDKTGFFADRYYGVDSSRFAVPDGLWDFTFGDTKDAAALFPVMTLYFLFGASAYDGASDFSYAGAEGAMPELLPERFNLAALFENFVFYEAYAVSTRWVKTNADTVERHSDGFYYHIWKSSYYGMTSDLNPNRPMDFTYIEPHVDAYYMTAFLIAALFVALMLVFLVIVPISDKKATARMQGNGG